MKGPWTNVGVRHARRWETGWLVLAIACFGMTGTVACRSDRSTSGCTSAERPAAPVDAALAAFLSAARALHHEADLRQGEGDMAGAIASLERLVTLPAPKATEVEEVLADAHARLAELRLVGGDLEGADRDVRAGLAQVRGPTYFRGHLLEVGGLVEEARSGALVDAGKAEEATRARARAVTLLEEAVRVDERVIQRALADGGSNE